MAHDDETHDAAITPDGRFVVTVISGRPELHVWELTTGRRVAPPLRVGILGGSWCPALAIPPDGRRVMVGFSTPRNGNSLAVVDLESLLSPATARTADLAHLAELATGRRIELGDLSALTTEQWMERWSRLCETSPNLTGTLSNEPKSAK